MKSLYMSFLIITGALLGGIEAYGTTATIVFKKVKDGGSMAWIGSELMPCGGRDSTCSRYVISSSGSGGIVQYGNGFVLEANVTGVSVGPTSGGPTLTMSGANQSFDDKFDIQIITCDQYPQLNGRQVTLDGVNSNGSGSISVYFP